MSWKPNGIYPLNPLSNLLNPPPPKIAEIQPFDYLIIKADHIIMLTSHMAAGPYFAIAWCCNAET